MTTTISVSEVTKAKFDELRPTGASSADEFLSVLLDYYEDGDVPADVTSLSDEDIQEIINAVAAKADGEGRVDSDKLAREVARKLDYAELAKSVADELEGRMR
jgi:hypothetical protein